MASVLLGASLALWGDSGDTLFCCSTQPDTHGTFWPCCIILPTQRGSGTDPWLPSHGSGVQGGPAVPCRAVLQGQRGRCCWRAAVCRVLLCGTAWQEHRGLESCGFVEKNSGEQSAPFTGSEHQNAAALEVLEKFRRQQLFFLHSALNESSKHVKLLSEVLTHVNEKTFGTLLFLFWGWWVDHTGLCCVMQPPHWEQQSQAVLVVFSWGTFKPGFSALCPFLSLNSLCR